MCRCGEDGNLSNSAGMYQKVHQFTLAGDIVALTRELDEHPESVQAVDEGGRTPLCMAALRTSETVVKLLLDRGADVNEICLGATPLMLSAQEGYVENCKVLLAAGAHMTARDAEGRTALERAIRWNQWAAAAFLRDAMKKHELDNL